MAAILGMDDMGQGTGQMKRRDFVRGGLGLLAVSVGGFPQMLSPREARAAGAAFNVLSSTEVTALEALGEVFLPGARAAGVANFIDYHLSVDPRDSLLMLRYMDWPPPYSGFYKGGLAALDAVSTTRYAKLFAALSPVEQAGIVQDMGGGMPEGWQGIPAPLFYFVLRSDAVDVVYGTPEGFEKLGVPYMAHIEPPTRW